MPCEDPPACPCTRTDSHDVRAYQHRYCGRPALPAGRWGALRLGQRPQPEAGRQARRTAGMAAATEQLVRRCMLGQECQVGDAMPGSACKVEWLPFLLLQAGPRDPEASPPPAHKLVRTACVAIERAHTVQVSAYPCASGCAPCALPPSEHQLPACCIDGRRRTRTRRAGAGGGKARRLPARRAPRGTSSTWRPMTASLRRRPRLRRGRPPMGRAQRWVITVGIGSAARLRPSAVDAWRILA